VLDLVVGKEQAKKKKICASDIYIRFTSLLKIWKQQEGCGGPEHLVHGSIAQAKKIRMNHC
jgi:hypothetical protein